MTILVNKSGVLSCAICIKPTDKPYWCPHIEDWLQAGSDAPEFWEDAWNDKIPVLVPYIPSYHQWATCKLGPVTNASRTLHLEFRNSQEFIGFVNEHEGRFVFRSMLHDWFQPRIDYDASCQSTSHSYDAEMGWQADMKGKDVQRRFAQRWSVANDSRCLQCAGAIVAIDDEDLIPDPAPTIWKAKSKTATGSIIGPSVSGLTLPPGNPASAPVGSLVTSKDGRTIGVTTSRSATGDVEISNVATSGSFSSGITVNSSPDTSYTYTDGEKY